MPRTRREAGDSHGATAAMILFAYGLLLKVLLVYSVIYHDCTELRGFWIESALLPVFAAILMLLALWASAPFFRHRSGADVPGTELIVSGIAVAFAVYISVWLIVLFAFLEGSGPVSQHLRDWLRFGLGRAGC